MTTAGALRPWTHGAVTALGLAGFGAIGQRVAVAVERTLPMLHLAAITSGDLDKARARAATLLQTPPPVVPLAELVALADVVVEAAPAAAFDGIATAVLEAGKLLLVVSGGALLDRYDAYTDLARRRGGRLYVASGAVGGLDALAAAATGEVDAVVMTTRKPPAALAGAPYLRAHGIDVLALAAPQVVFEGTAREACRGFPANVNVAAAVSLAGIGPDRTGVRIIADPRVTRNMHEVEVTGAFGRFCMQVENVPTENPRTGVLAAQSVVAALRKLAAPVWVGT
ncbi:MAG: aspartate dehydrogenase [Armatimonadota bacterium]|nr:aspartate dehydrogenase [Armatimonadota bacterium]MDR7485679.1 aspartate dehydrogenase [Armatimonadota bacterium]MDR7533072.1 aspartate dehydrogenase [Armatimonadota bacterium]MDR7535896.1 aspartate dehydrogenase [Armatimonadota bacterium]